MCRADTVYRLCYSSLIIHWRSYMMFTRDSLFKSLFSFDEVTTGHWTLECSSHSAIHVPCSGVCGHVPDPQHAAGWQQDL